ncbi:hypothetical protein BCR43DRAFT_495545 [Syncephalastrum racemosum]|uniref:Myb-like domain-containing protein n=1 Tax=Syncephalastrum racemosum TaxID=13706 RepID=A0A1X2H626_SYNRA|nr:hypothetical protein BCR43DRAFT_495545 [Syncephalastrum racemosum]
MKSPMLPFLVSSGQSVSIPPSFLSHTSMTLPPRPRIDESQRWLMLGAHYEGLSDVEIGGIVGLRASTVHHCIQNFKRSRLGTGSRDTRQRRAARMRTLAQLRTSKSSGTSSTSLGSFEASQRHPVTRDIMQHVISTAHQSSNETASNEANSNTTTPATAMEEVHTPYSNMYAETDVAESPWTEEDDRILMLHALTQLGHWDTCETKLESRHSAGACLVRWEHLRDILLDTIDQTGTEAW